MSIDCLNTSTSEVVKIENEIIYKEVPRTGGRYLTTSDGRIWDNKYQQFIAQNINRRGWYRCHIWQDGKRITTGVHRVIMSAFCGESDLSVNHKDGDKSNNAISNLEYMTLQEQNYHRSYVLKTGNRVPIKCLENGKVYETIKAACDDLGINYDSSHISEVIKHKYGFKSSHGYHFEKVEDNQSYVEDIEKVSQSESFGCESN